MAAIILFFLLVTGFSISTAQQKKNEIIPGSSLSPNTNNSFWLSSSGQFAFGFYQQDNGFAVGIWLEKMHQKTVVWTAKLDNLPLPQDVKLLLNDNGTLVLQYMGGDQTFLVADSSQPTASASMLNSGNFVLYNSDLKIIWQSFESPTDTLLPGQSLPEEKALI